LSDSAARRESAETFRARKARRRRVVLMMTCFEERLTQRREGTKEKGRG
jgi:hypothetical protein